MKKEYSLFIDEVNQNKRLDVAISNISDLSRSSLKNHLLKILVNGKVEKLSYKCRLNDKIDIELEWDEYNLIPEDIKLDIIFEDAHYIVINKKYGMVVHPAAGNFTGTVVNALLGMKKKLAITDEEFRPGIVHRLDKETSGILLIAKNNEAHAYVSGLFQKRQIEKGYKALIKGFYTPSKHTIINNIGRDPHNRKKMAVLDNKIGRKSITHVEVIKHFTKYSFLDIRLETGRTHQIRVHLSHRGYPVLGDMIYARKDKNFANIPLCLVADYLSFFDKFSNSQLKFEIDLPSYFSDVLKNK